MTRICNSTMKNFHRFIVSSCNLMVYLNPQHFSFIMVACITFIGLYKACNNKKLKVLLPSKTHFPPRGVAYNMLRNTKSLSVLFVLNALLCRCSYIPNVWIPYKLCCYCIQLKQMINIHDPCVLKCASQYIHHPCGISKLFFSEEYNNSLECAKLIIRQ